jgi:hypothetical protein
MAADSSTSGPRAQVIHQPMSIGLRCASLTVRGYSSAGGVEAIGFGGSGRAPGHR